MDDRTKPLVRLEGVTLDCVDPRALAQFYRQLLGATETREESDPWVTIAEPVNGISISFQRSDHYRPPVWPPEADEPLPMAHLELAVRDLDQACAHAESLGARPMSFQPQENVRVYADPEGHPFCLFV